ncbi:hypothetical protein M0811_05061 [Anaeramoeba ignava]|uniref:Uncharacterized protein n=1 Tax=Anaeramoeba ignava TaxID=1746090 RepID=A0A9Q0LSN5_ANAIG|nr:hypothetical protein M0811_05061 [Anaeramoeba ignava]
MKKINEVEEQKFYVIFYYLYFKKIQIHQKYLIVLNNFGNIIIWINFLQKLFWIYIKESNMNESLEIQDLPSRNLSSNKQIFDFWKRLISKMSLSMIQKTKVTYENTKLPFFDNIYTIIKEDQFELEENKSLLEYIEETISNKKDIYNSEIIILYIQDLQSITLKKKEKEMIKALKIDIFDFLKKVSQENRTYQSILVEIYKVDFPSFHSKLKLILEIWTEMKPIRKYF